MLGQGEPYQGTGFRNQHHDVYHGKDDVVSKRVRKIIYNERMLHLRQLLTSDNPPGFEGGFRNLDNFDGDTDEEKKEKLKNDLVKYLQEYQIHLKGDIKYKYDTIKLDIEGFSLWEEYDEASLTRYADIYVKTVIEGNDLMELDDAKNLINYQAFHEHLVQPIKENYRKYLEGQPCDERFNRPEFFYFLELMRESKVLDWFTLDFFEEDFFDSYE